MGRIEMGALAARNVNIPNNRQVIPLPLATKPPAQQLQQPDTPKQKKPFSRVDFPQPPSREEGKKKTTDHYFCYLMKQLGSYCKNEANIKVAREPYQDVDGHNRGDASDKSTKPAKGLWQVEMIVGPFPTEFCAAYFRMAWMLYSRNTNSRRTCGIAMTEELRKDAIWSGLYCFDKRLVPFPLNTYLVYNGLECLCVSEETFEKLVRDVAVAQYQGVVKRHRKASLPTTTAATTKTTKKKKKKKQKMTKTSDAHLAGRVA